MRTLIIALASALLLTCIPVNAHGSNGEHAKHSGTSPDTLYRFIVALRLKESSSTPLHVPFARGDGGRARGPLQIHRICWTDAGMREPYAQADRWTSASTCAKRYLTRYGKEHLDRGDYFALACMWNGGPDGESKAAARKYAADVMTIFHSISGLSDAQLAACLRDGVY